VISVELIPADVMIIHKELCVWYFNPSTPKKMKKNRYYKNLIPMSRDKSSFSWTVMFGGLIHFDGCLFWASYLCVYACTCVFT